MKFGVNDFAFGFNLNSFAFGFKEDFFDEAALPEIPDNDEGEDGAVVDAVEFRGERGVSMFDANEGCAPPVDGSSN